MSGMQDGGREAVHSGLLEQKAFDTCFTAAIIPEGFSRLLLRRGDLDTRAVNPDRAAVEKVAYSPAQSVCQLLRAFQCVTGEVDDYVGFCFRDALSEAPCRFFSAPIKS
jgi:hypothetical protein